MKAINFLIISMFSITSAFASTGSKDLANKIFSALDCGTMEQPADGVLVMDYSKNEIVNAYSVYMANNNGNAACQKAFARLTSTDAGILTDGQLYKDTRNDLSYSVGDFYFHGRSDFLSIRAVRAKDSTKLTGFMLMIPYVGQGEYDNDLVYTVRTGETEKCNSTNLDSVKFKSYEQKEKAQNALSTLCSEI